MYIYFYDAHQQYNEIFERRVGVLLYVYIYFRWIKKNKRMSYTQRNVYDSYLKRVAEEIFTATHLPFLLIPF